jgi:hypothetical protein
VRDEDQEAEIAGTFTRAPQEGRSEERTTGSEERERRGEREERGKERERRLWRGTWKEQRV